jgi:hypothetical protein
MVELFRQAGYDPMAPGWPGEPDTVAEAREHPEYVANIGINDITGHYADIIDGLAQQPVIIGHSFGGLIAEKLLGQDVGAAALPLIRLRSKAFCHYPWRSCEPDSPPLEIPQTCTKQCL